MIRRHGKFLGGTGFQKADAVRSRSPDANGRQSSQLIFYTFTNAFDLDDWICQLPQSFGAFLIPMLRVHFNGILTVKHFQSRRVAILGGKGCDARFLHPEIIVVDVKSLVFAHQSGLWKFSSAVVNDRCVFHRYCRFVRTRAHHAIHIAHKKIRPVFTQNAVGEIFRRCACVIPRREKTTINDGNVREAGTLPADRQIFAGGGLLLQGFNVIRCSRRQSNRARNLRRILCPLTRLGPREMRHGCDLAGIGLGRICAQP